jgi:type VI secretion system secreted protein VgrG
MSDNQQPQASGASPADRILAIDTPLGPDAVTLLSLDGEDVLSRCFLYRIVIITAEPVAAVRSLLGMPVTLWLMHSDPDRQRPIHGIVRRLVGNGSDLHGNRRYRLEVVPRLWFLSCTSDCRIFQNQSIPDILRTVLLDHELSDIEFRITGSDYQPVDYCVQYRESALDFLSRLMEHLGLFYWHEHSADKHLLVIGDRNMAARMCDPESVRIFEFDETDQLRTLEIDYSFRPGKWTLNDYDFESPTKQLLVGTPTVSKVPRMTDYEIYEYPGDFRDRDAGRLLSRVRVEMEEAQHLRVFGTGRCAGFDPGRRVTVAGAPGEPGTTYLLTEVRHHAISPGLDGHDSSRPVYTNEFVAIQADLPFRPERVTPKPFVRGTQTAVVVGPSGEHIYCDEYGRVRVQFHWDRRGKRDETSSCWVRVAQTRAGSHYGALTIPHVGHEVIVSFIEGDPDRPLITGSVANALTMPPVALPDDKNKTIQRDDGDNKIVMQGKAGQQNLTIVSPRTINHFAGPGPGRALSSGLVVGAVLDNDSIPTWRDGAALANIQQNWAQYSQGITSPDASINANTASVGNINTLNLVNNNTWSVGNVNLWTGGNINQYVAGDQYQEFHGGSDAIFFDYQTQTILGDNNTTVLGSNNQEFFGGNGQITIGANSQITVGLNFQWNMGASFAWTIGPSITLDSDGWNTADVKMTALGAKIDDCATEVKTCGMGVSAMEALSVTHQLQIENIITALKNINIDVQSGSMKIFA